MEKIITKCDCGKVIFSTSKSQLKYNLQQHKKSKQHKRRMKEQEYSVCQRCGKQPTNSIIIHHKNMNHNDNSIKNLAYICNECHSFIHSNKNINLEFLNIEFKWKCPECNKSFKAFTQKDLDFYKETHLLSHRLKNKEEPDKYETKEVD